MFNKMGKNSEPNDRDTRQEPSDSARSEFPRDDDYRTRSCSYVGPNLRIKGEITVDESLSIEGEIEGTITSTEHKRLIVGKRGRVNAEIKASAVEVRGNLEGNIHSTDVVHIYSTGAVKGTIECKRLVVDDGAVFNGRVNMRRKDMKDQAKGKLVLASNNDEDDIARSIGS